MKNEMEITFDAISNNESFARVAVAAFIAHLNPTLEEMADIKKSKITLSVKQRYVTY